MIELKLLGVGEITSWDLIELKRSVDRDSEADLDSIFEALRDGKANLWRFKDDGHFGVLYSWECGDALRVPYIAGRGLAPHMSYIMAALAEYARLSGLVAVEGKGTPVFCRIIRKLGFEEVKQPDGSALLRKEI